MNHRASQLLLGVALVAGVSCIDMSAPSDSPASISALQVPAAFVVRGDSMRDSTGAAAPLSLIAYDQNDVPVSGVKANFFITDTGHIAHITSDNVVVAADTTGLVHVIGQIGNIQTPAVIVYVTAAPAQLTGVPNPSDTLVAKAAGNDTANGRGTKGASVRVLAVDGTTPVPGVVVHFAITHTPDTLQTNKSHAVYLVDDQNKLSSVDTADGSGQASRTVVVITQFLAHTTNDSVVVEACASYRGQPLKSCGIHVVIPIRVGF